jgi:hypothetical protein
MMNLPEICDNYLLWHCYEDVENARFYIPMWGIEWGTDFKNKKGAT